MELTWGTLVFLIIAAIGLWFWRDSLQVRELANAAAMEACERMGLQFLDGTVAFSKLRLVREDGVIHLRRTYIFDYTAHSIDRMQGFVVLVGTRVETVGFARSAERMQRAAPEPAPLRVSYSLNVVPKPRESIAAADQMENGDAAPKDRLEQVASDSTTEVPSAPDTDRPKAKVLKLDDWRTSRTRH